MSDGQSKIYVHRANLPQGPIKPLIQDFEKLFAKIHIFDSNITTESLSFILHFKCNSTFQFPNRNEFIGLLPARLF